MGWATGGLRRLDRRASAGLIILMYHRVLPDRECASHPTPGLVVSESAFRQQVEWLSRHARVLPVVEGLARLDDPEATDQPAVCLTFDDGYRDNFAVAAPVLEERDLRGSFYVTTGPVETGSLIWTDEAHLSFTQVRRGVLEDALRSTGAGPFDISRLARWVAGLRALPPADRDRVLREVRPVDGYEGAERFRMMSVPEVAELSASGHEIGSHTVTHPPLTPVDDVVLEAETVSARAAIERWLGRPVQGFCFPRGDTDDRVEQAVRAAGHSYALTTEPGLNLPGENRFRLRRRAIKMTRVLGASGRPSRLAFRAECNGFHDRLRDARRG